MVSWRRQRLSGASPKARGTAALDVLLPDGLLVSETLTVQGRLSDYVETSAMATRSSARLIDIPQAIAVLPARLLEDIGALDTKDLYRHISGVVDSPYSSTVVRGFTQREVLVNGMRGNPFGSLEGDVASSGFSTSQFRLTNVERVEVLKGPASVLYGPGEPGGVINYVTKKPKDTFQVRAVTGTARFNQRLGEIDRLERDNRSLRERVAHSEERERQLHDAILRGKKVSDEMISTSQREAQLLVREAEITAERMVGQAAERAAEVESRIGELRMRRKELQLKFCLLYTSDAADE